RTLGPATSPDDLRPLDRAKRLHELGAGPRRVQRTIGRFRSRRAGGPGRGTVRARVQVFSLGGDRRVPGCTRRTVVTPPHVTETSALPMGAVASEDVTVATGLLVDPDFGTTAGMSAARHRRPIPLVVTTAPGHTVARLPGDDIGAQVRALRDRITR